jgi:hypothetical protein
VTIAIRPLRVRDGENDKADFSRSRSDLFFVRGVDGFSRERPKVPDGQINTLTGNFRACSHFVLDRANMHGTDRAPMAYAQTSWLCFRKGIGGKSTWLAVALAVLLATPSLSQDAGVSGIPPGPGNVNGLNGSIRDPSGIGNASRMPSLPQPSIRPVTPSTATSTRPMVRQGVTRVRVARGQRTRYMSARGRHRAERAAVRENDRLLKHGVTSICRGC